jgi:hypothetical protein
MAEFPNFPKHTEKEISELLRFCSGLIFKDEKAARAGETWESSVAAYNLINVIYMIPPYDELGPAGDAVRYDYLIAYTELNPYYANFLVKARLRDSSGNDLVGKTVITRALVAAMIASDNEVIHYPNDIIKNPKEASKMVDFHRQSLVYYRTVLHSDGLSKYEKYWNYINFVTIIMAMDRFVTWKMETLVDVDVVSERDIRNLLASYGMDLFDDMPLRYRRRLVKNINYLLRNKGTSKAIVRIVQLFGYEDVKIFKYFLIKDFERDLNGNIVDLNDAEGTLRPELYFAKVEEDETELESKFLSDTTERLDYDAFVSPDPLWQVDSSKAANEDFNYVGTKYLSVDVSVDILKVSVQNALFFNFLKRFASHGPEKAASPLSIVNSDISENPINIVDVMVALSHAANNFLGFEDMVVDGNAVPYLLNTHDFEPEDGVFWDPNISPTINQAGIDGFSTDDEGAHITYPHSSRAPGINALNRPIGEVGGASASPFDLVQAYKENYLLREAHRNAMIAEHDQSEYLRMRAVYDAKFTKIATNEFWGSHETLASYLRTESPDLLAFIESRTPSEALDSLISALEGFVEDSGVPDVPFDATLNPIEFGIITYFVRRIVDVFKAYTTQFRDLNRYYVYRDPLDDTVSMREDARFDIRFGLGEWMRRTTPEPAADYTYPNTVGVQSDIEFNEMLRYRDSVTITLFEDSGLRYGST